jgi:hypothetical protein
MELLTVARSREPGLVTLAHDRSSRRVAFWSSHVTSFLDRMPIVLERDVFATWLDPNVRDVKSIMKAANANGLSMFPVSTDVNSVRNDRPELIERRAEPVVEAPRQQVLF